MAVEKALSERDEQRYARHLTLDGVGRAGQEKLAAARVLVVGAGGLGSPVVSYLAGMGVGRLVIVDDDVVELSNLPRQIVHIESFVGRPKVESMADAVRRQNSGVEVDARREALTVDLALALVPECDVVVDCTDSVEARYVLNDACVLLGVPFVWASIAQFAGQLGVVMPQEGPCYRCLFGEPADVAGGLTCEQGGVLGVLPGVMGTLQATEVVKLLLGLGDSASDAIRFYDTLGGSMATIPVARDPECPACGRGVSFAGLALEPGSADDGKGGRPDNAARCELHAGDGAIGAGRVVVDVRNASELEKEPLPADVVDGALAVMHEPWGSGWDEATTDRVAGATDGRGVVVVCARGMRSAAAVDVLRARGVDAWSLRGGVAGLRRRVGS